MVFMGAPLNFCGTRLSTPELFFFRSGQVQSKPVGGTVGGPIAKNRLFFFVTIKEHEREKASIPA